MGEITKVAEAIHSPTSCIRCQSHVGPFADIDVELHFEGQIYLCKLCIDGAIRAMGGCTAEERAELEVKLSDAGDKLEAMRAKVLEAKREVISDLLAFQKELVA